LPVIVLSLTVFLGFVGNFVLEEQFGVFYRTPFDQWLNLVRIARQIIFPSLFLIAEEQLTAMMAIQAGFIFLNVLRRDPTG
jgi:hypothetical protein